MHNTVHIRWWSASPICQESLFFTPRALLQVEHFTTERIPPKFLFNMPMNVGRSIIFPFI